MLVARAGRIGEDLRRPLGGQGTGREAFQQHPAAPVVDHRPDRAAGPHRRGKGGGQCLPGGDPDDRQPGAEADALGQRQRRADAGEAARPDHRGNRIEVRRHQAGRAQHRLGHRRQQRGMAALARRGLHGQHAVARQHGGRATRQRGIERQDPGRPAIVSGPGS